MASYLIQDIPPLDGGNFTGPVRMQSGIGKTVNPVLGQSYGEKMQWIYVGSAGNISYKKWDGTDQLLIGLQPGIWHHILSIQINLAGTTATGIVVGS